MKLTATCVTTLAIALGLCAPADAHEDHGPALLQMAQAAAAGTGQDDAAKTRVVREQPHLAALLASPAFATARKSLADDYDRMVADIVTLTQIPAPPFKEEARARAYLEMLRAEGLEDVETDEVGNAMGLLKGHAKDRASLPLLVVTAHLDTVFPEGTDVTVTREGDTLRAPGIGDDTSSLPVLLAFVRAIRRAGIAPAGDILFMGNVGEEGPGDLRGTRHLFTKGKYKDRIGAFISFEPGHNGRVTNGGTGSRRYKVTFKGPGGHSFGAFGLVNPAFAMGDAIVEFGKLAVPQEPKTTYSVGLVEGGTSVNSIPFETAMTIDMRSNGKAELAALEKQFLAILPQATARENAARSTAQGAISFDAQLIGDRPVGTTPPEAAIVQIASGALEALGIAPRLGAGSTDSNMAMSLGIPAVTLGAGFDSSGAHSLRESITLDRPRDLAAMTAGLATVIALADDPARAAGD
ncbi:M20/M25/M40 family metallo-hydrolase [Novosphingobium aureum]|nr:M20/M25/M40 family metallo-hydrolase [Novosphingobium aureum]